MASSSNEDEAMALRAALSMIDDWDSNLSSLFELSSDSDVSRPKKSKSSTSTAPYKPRRDARKLEIAALRAEVEELQNVVALEKTLAKLGPSRSIESAALSMEWERLAATQKQERVAAEVENAKLRKLAQSQLKNVQQIVKLTKRVNQLEDALPVPRPISFEHYHVPHIDHVAQLDRLDAMRLRAVEIFSTGAFAPGGRECFREVLFSLQTQAVKGVDLEFQAAWMLPFEVERVAHALWVQTMRPTFKEKTVAHEVVYEDANTMVSKFLATPCKNEWGSSQGQSAGRMLPPDAGDGSILIVVKVTARTYADTCWKGSADVEGWLRVQPVDTASESLSGRVSRVQWYRRTLFQPPDDAGLSSTDRRKWTNAVITGPTRSRFQRDLDWSVQAVDNLLLTPRATE